MKILFFAYTFKDYGMDVLFDGLCRALGNENVFEYPNKTFLHVEDSGMYPNCFSYPIVKSDPEKHVHLFVLPRHGNQTEK